MSRLDRQPVVASGSHNRVTAHDAFGDPRDLRQIQGISRALGTRRGARSASANVGLRLNPVGVKRFVR